MLIRMYKRVKELKNKIIIKRISHHLTFPKAWSELNLECDLSKVFVHDGPHLDREGRYTHACILCLYKRSVNLLCYSCVKEVDVIRRLATARCRWRTNIDGSRRAVPWKFPENFSNVHLKPNPLQSCLPSFILQYGARIRQTEVTEPVPVRQKRSKKSRKVRRGSASAKLHLKRTRAPFDDLRSER